MGVKNGTTKQRIGGKKWRGMVNIKKIGTNHKNDRVTLEGMGRGVV